MNITNKIESALQLAKLAHCGQKRKFTGVKYFEHPMAVAELVSILKDSKNLELLIISAILHDVVEDTYITLKDIANIFGYKVAALVEELTSDPIKIKEMGKKEYLADKMFKMSTYALVIKLIDRYHNMVDLIKGKSHTIKYVTETIYILDRLERRKLTKTHIKIIKLIRDRIEELK